MKWKFRLLILLGLTAAWFFYRWQREQTQLPFSAEPIALDSSQIEWFTISRPGGEDWLFKREGNHWLLNKGALTVQPRPETVAALLSQCTHFSSDSIRRQTGREPNPFPEEKAFRFLFYRGEKIIDGFSLWPAATDESLAKAWLQPKGQREVYLISEGNRQACFLPFEAFLNKDILPFPPSQLNYFALLDSSGYLLRAFRHDSLWTDSSGQVLQIPQLDSLLRPGFLPDTFRQFTSAPPFENHRTLLLSASQHLPKGQDKSNAAYLPSKTNEDVAIKIYYDSLSPLPFIYESSLYPDLFFREDSSGLFRAFGFLLSD